MAFPIHFSASVKSIDRHNSDLATFVLAPTGRLPKFKPGQFVHLTLEPYDPSTHWPESRAFSVASAPSNKSELRLTIGRQGAYTSRILDEVAEGRTLALKGPYGELVVAPTSPSDEVVLIAGGTGVTPFCSYLEEASLAPERHTNPIHLFYAVRRPSAFIYRSLVEACAQKLSNLKTHFFAEESPDSETIPGRLNLDQILSRLPKPQSALFYLSGPQAMIKSFSEALVQTHGIPPHRVIIDAWQ
jgi:ferredoxin-NADP reductase